MQDPRVRRWNLLVASRWRNLTAEPEVLAVTARARSPDELDEEYAARDPTISRGPSLLVPTVRVPVAGSGRPMQSALMAASALSSTGRTEVYRLRGHVDDHLDLEFQEVERFVGLGAGDVVEASPAGAGGRHPFVKPRAAGVATNLTIITSRSPYHDFDYQASDRRPDPGVGDVVYVMIFRVRAC